MPKFTDIEEKYMEALRAAAPQIVTRQQFNKLRKVPGHDGQQYQSNLVDVHIKNLRKKLKGTQWSIASIRGEGYLLEEKAV